MAVHLEQPLDIDYDARGPVHHRIRRLRRIWIESAAALLAVVVLGGCATSKDELLPHGDSTMLDIWNQETGGSAGGGQAARQLLDARQGACAAADRGRRAGGARRRCRYTRTAQNEIYRQFHRLPNPDLVMYVFPAPGRHRPGAGARLQHRVPAYQRVQYAMPGERLEDY